MQLSEVFQYALFGVGIGAIYALAAQGLILIYRGSGVINFAQGSLALVGAAVYTQLRDQLPVAAAAIVGVAVAAVGGALIQVLVMYPLRRSSPLTRLVATLGLLIFIDQLVTLHYNHGVVFVPSLLPTFPVHFGSGVIVGVDRLILFGIACALTLVLWLVYRFTPFGLATSAVAENERAAASLGHSPPLIAAINWTLGGGLAGLAGVLLVGVTGLDPVALPIIVVIALAGALVGGFSSFPLALVGALLIGILEAELTRYVSAPGWSESVPFLVIIAVLVIRGRALPQRSHLQELLPDLGTGRVRLWLVVPAVAAWVALAGAFTNDWAAAVASTMVMAIVCLSVVVVTGYCGQLSLAQFALAGVGAYISARLAAVYGIPFPLAMLIGVAGTIPVGVAVAIPAMRTRGVNLAVVTIGLALVIEKLLLNNTANTGGILGTTVPEPTIFGISVFSITHPVRYATLTIGVFAVAALVVANLRRGAAGRRLLAVRANERAAACLGINVVGAKLYAFGLGAGIAASAGVLLAFRTPHVDFARYGGLQSIYAVVNAVIGGVGFLFGAFMGGTFADQGVTQEILTNYGDAYRYVTIASGALLVLVVMFNPNGLASEQVRQMRWLGSAMRRLPVLRRLPVRAARPLLLTPPTSSARPHPSTLEVSSISVSFGGVEALAGVSLAVHPGEVVGLIGPNG
ncbi:MAG TPA: ABC transporter, partial [Candidatus Dormibacteraeota bacterium]